MHASSEHSVSILSVWVDPDRWRNHLLTVSKWKQCAYCCCHKVTGIHHFPVLVFTASKIHPPTHTHTHAETHRLTRTHTHTHTHAAKPSNPLHVQHILHFFLLLFSTSLHNTEKKSCAQVTCSGLDLSIAPPGQLGREEVEKEKGKKKKREREREGDDGRKAHNNSLFPCMLGPAA